MKAVKLSEGKACPAVVNVEHIMTAEYETNSENTRHAIRIVYSNGTVGRYFFRTKDSALTGLDRIYESMNEM